MKLNLKKPLAFFDLETTGVNVGSDRIVEIAIIKVMPDGTTLTRPEKPGRENRFLINPGIPIPLTSSLVHGIYDEDVANAPKFEEVAATLYKFLHDCDLAGFNSNKFDIPMLAEEFLRVGVDFNMEGRNLIDVQVIFHQMEQRTLKAGYKFYCGKDLDDAHEALPDTLATKEIFEAQLEKYQGTEIDNGAGQKFTPIVNDMEKIHEFCQRQRSADLAGRMVFDENGVIVFNFGKYKGMGVKEILKKDPGYYGWMMQGDFPLYTKKVLSELRNEN
jgi:DNA polymerase-3 subunit epsilon